DRRTGIGRAGEIESRLPLANWKVLVEPIGPGELFKPRARLDAVGQRLTIAGDGQQRLGNVVIRLQVGVGDRPIRDRVAPAAEILETIELLECGRELEVDREGAKRPRAPNHAAATEDRTGPAVLERNSGVARPSA